MSKMEDIRHRKGIMYRDLFKTPLGEQVLEDLESQFSPPKLSTDNPHTTALRVGENTPIRYINRRIKDGMDG